MVKVSLKKTLLKQDLLLTIKGLINALNISVNIKDEKENLILIMSDAGLPGLMKYPIKAGDEIIGWIEGEEKAEIVAQTLNCIAYQEWEKKILAAETLEKYEEINFLYDLSAKISTCLTLEDISRLVINEIKNLVEYERIYIMLFKTQTKTRHKKTKLEPLLEIIADSESSSNFNLLESNIINHVLKTGREEIINNVFCDPRVTDANSTIRSLICLPLTIQNKTIGIVSIIHSKPTNYTTEDLKLLIALASQTAAAIQAAQYYNSLKDYSYKLEQEVAKRTRALETAKKRLEKIASTDKLTQLANRRKFDHYLFYEWRRAMREQIPISLILCDVDYFKRYNDFYGHPEGDKCLQKVAAVMKKMIKRSADLVARYGGEEFAIILCNTNEEGARKVAENIRLEIERWRIPHVVLGADQYVTVSLGVSTIIPKPHTSPQILIKAADTALYQAKNSGRNCCYVL